MIDTTKGGKEEAKPPVEKTKVKEPAKAETQESGDNTMMYLSIGAVAVAAVGGLVYYLSRS